MKRKTIIVSAILTAAMMTAPMSVFAEDTGGTTIDQASDNKSGSMTATYSVSPSYTVTIPASVTLSSTDPVTATISAGAVMLEEGKCVVVKLTEAQNTEEGSLFHAKVGNSTARYTISVGDGDENRVRVGDAVATFGTSTDPQTSVLTFSPATGATYAGTHTETLTFSLAVVNSGSTVMIGEESYTYTPGQTWSVLVEANGWIIEFSDIYSDQYKMYMLQCGNDSVSPEDPIDGSKTYQWVDVTSP